MVKIVDIKKHKSEEIVGLLKDLLERAKNGEFVGFAYAAELEGQKVAYGWERASGSNVHQLFAGVLYLQTKMGIDAVGTSEDSSTADD